MLKSFLICDSNGIPFYSRTFNEFEMIDDALFSGLITAVGQIGKSLFHQNIATIQYGENKTDASSIAVISRELFGSDKTISFVFFYSGEMELRRLRELSTMIFMEAKNVFRKTVLPDAHIVKERINRIINNRFNGLADW